MAIDATAAATSRRNVEPLSSVLDIQTLDVDASGLTFAPEDGEFVFFHGHMEACTNAKANLVADAGGVRFGASLAMVWSEVGRSDIQATGRKRVPVIFRKSFHCELALYNYDSGSLPIAGEPLVVAAAKVAIQGDTAAPNCTRLVAEAIGDDDLGAGDHWVVGYVASSVATAGDPMEVVLYDQPRLMTIAA